MQNETQQLSGREVWVPTLALIPYDRNPRRMFESGMAKLRRSIREFGFTVPILAQESTRMIIAGHQRWTAAKLEGLTQVPVIFLPFDFATAVAYNIADNRLGEEAEWDEALLAGLLKELDGKTDLSLTGFGTAELDALLDSLREAVGSGDQDPAIPDPPSDPVTKPGDLWQLGRHRLICGDCTVRGIVDRLMDGQTVDSMVTDPPYGVDYSAKNEFLNAYGKGNHVQTDIVNDDLTDYRAFFADFLKVAPMADYNTAYIFMMGQELHSLRLAFDDAGFKWSDYLIWAKNNAVLGRKDYMAKHEFVVYGWKGRHRFYGGNPKPNTILEYDRPFRNDLHPTMKPLDLYARLIEDGSPEGGRFYDPFCGSGTAIIAAEQTRRTCYAVELKAGYCDVIIERWQKHTGQTAILLNRAA